MAKPEKDRHASGAQQYEGPFIAIPVEIINSPLWAAMSTYEVKLLLDIAEPYRGANNGDLCCTWGRMSARGWRSRGSLDKALAGLLDKGLIEVTRRGGKRVCSLYALTWRCIDNCGGKLDVPATRVPSHAWRKWRADDGATDTPRVSIPRKSLDTPRVLSQHPTSVKGRPNADF